MTNEEATKGKSGPQFPHQTHMGAFNPLGTVGQQENFACVCVLLHAHRREPNAAMAPGLRDPGNPSRGFQM